MRFARADPVPGSPAGARRRRCAALVVAALAVLATGCSGDTSITPPSASAGAIVARAAAARETIADLDRAFRLGDRPAAEALGTDGARDLLSAAVGNIEALDLADVSLRFVEDRAALMPEETDDYGPGAWVGTVAVAYRLRGWDEAGTEVETPMTFVPRDDGQAIAGIGGVDGRTPLWLAGPVNPVVSGRALILARGDAGSAYGPLAARALRAVAAVLPDWDGRLVIEVPATHQELNRALDAPQERYANIAAVTAAVDGSLRRTAPVHVFINPSIFDPLGPRAAQVVISHESAHVATAGARAAIPGWLLEGFADYVALAHEDIPVTTAAAQILEEVRRDGPPSGLPTAEDLSPTAPGLGATYEEAWLANRFLAAEYGEAKLVEFYRTVDAGTSAADAFREVLGTTEAAFVKAWRADLQALADRLPG